MKGRGKEMYSGTPSILLTNEGVVQQNGHHHFERATCNLANATGIDCMC